MAGPIKRCGLCKAELPENARHGEWGYKYGTYKFCSYGCMRNYQSKVAAQKKETYERKEAEKAARKAAKQAAEMEHLMQKQEQAAADQERRIDEATDKRMAELFERLEETAQETIDDVAPVIDDELPAVQAAAALPKEPNDLMMVTMTREQCQLLSDTLTEQLTNMLSCGTESIDIRKFARIELAAEKLAEAAGRE